MRYMRLEGGKAPRIPSMLYTNEATEVDTMVISGEVVSLGMTYSLPTVMAIGYSTLTSGFDSNKLSLHDNVLAAYDATIVKENESSTINELPYTKKSTLHRSFPDFVGNFTSLGGTAPTGNYSMNMSMDFWWTRFNSYAEIGTPLINSVDFRVSFDRVAAPSFTGGPTDSPTQYAFIGKCVGISNYNPLYGEMIANPSFENSGSGGSDVFNNWVEQLGVGSIVKDTNSFHSGTSSCKLTAGLGMVTNIRHFLSVAEGYTYRVSFWAHGNGTSTGKYFVLNNNTGGGLVPTTLLTNTSTTFQMVTREFTVPSGCNSASLVFEVDSNGVSLNIDDVSVQRVVPPDANMFGVYMGYGYAAINQTVQESFIIGYHDTNHRGSIVVPVTEADDFNGEVLVSIDRTSTSASGRIHHADGTSTSYPLSNATLSSGLLPLFLADIESLCSQSNGGNPLIYLGRANDAIGSYIGTFSSVNPTFTAGGTWTNNGSTNINNIWGEKNYQIGPIDLSTIDANYASKAISLSGVAPLQFASGSTASTKGAWQELTAPLTPTRYYWFKQALNTHTKVNRLAAQEINTPSVGQPFELIIR